MTLYDRIKKVFKSYDLLELNHAVQIEDDRIPSEKSAGTVWVETKSIETVGTSSWTPIQGSKLVNVPCSVIYLKSGLKVYTDTPLSDILFAWRRVKEQASVPPTPLPRRNGLKLMKEDEKAFDAST